MYSIIKSCYQHFVMHCSSQGYIEKNGEGLCYVEKIYIYIRSIRREICMDSPLRKAPVASVLRALLWHNL